MNINRTIVIVFLSKLFNASISFITGVYFARLLGADVVGVYALVLSVAAWSIVLGEAGMGQAIVKRISENKESGAYFSAAIIWLLAILLLVSAIIILSRLLLENYISGFQKYVDISVIWILILVLISRSIQRFSTKSLNGEQKVYIAGLLSSFNSGLTGLLQIGLITVNFGLLGMVLGNVIGAVVTGALGIYLLTTRPTTPKPKHFRSLFKYAKFSWLGSIKSRTFNDVDILLLGFLLQPSQVGVYSVAWSIAKILELFGNSISSTIFPEISYNSVQESQRSVARLVENSIAYSGLIAIPGLVGGTILSERLLRIYGYKFVSGSVTLPLLFLAVLLRSYQTQILAGLNGIDRSDLAFRINAIFVILNVGLNIMFISYLGIEGAALASVMSVLITLVVAYKSLYNRIKFQIAIGWIIRQSLAAAIMGAVVCGVLFLNNILELFKSNILVTLVTVFSGCLIYSVLILLLIPELRKKLASFH